MFKKISCFLVVSLILFSCQKDLDLPQDIPNEPADEIYFPAIGSSEWETLNPIDLGWNSTAIQGLDAYMESTNTRALLVLKNGKMVIEKYRGESLLGLPFTENSQWYWASAAKTLTSTLTGIAQQEGYLELEDPSNQYLGTGWTSLDLAQESAITVRNHLTMTTGLDEKGDKNCTNPECLTYKSDPGTRWFYHNAPYTLIDGIISGSTNISFDDYFNSKLRDPIGMDGFWSYVDFNHLYFSTPRAMARFGLLFLNEGKWEQETILNTSFTQDMVSTSQALNPSYGYLWWLNGKSSHILPGLAISFQGPLMPNAPMDIFAGLGKNGQGVFVAPSEGLVVVRMGDNPDQSLVPVKFFNDLWDELNQVFND